MNKNKQRLVEISFDKKQTIVYLMVSVHQVFHFTTQDLDVRWSQQQHPKSANHLPLQLYLCTRPRRV